MLWYNLGITHIVRPEEWPIMNTHTMGFSLVPFGFFERNPAIVTKRGQKNTEASRVLRPDLKSCAPLPKREKPKLASNK